MPIHLHLLLGFGLLAASFVLFSLVVLGLGRLSVRRPLLDDLIILRPLNHAYLAEVAQEVRPHYMVLIDVGALNLRHGDEVVCE